MTKDTITVCASCLQASCWRGEFYCEDYKRAGTVEKTLEEFETLNLESYHYWKQPT
jgi:hypothetical protein